MAKPILLRLAVEELCLLQKALGIEELPGFEANLFSMLDDAQRVQALRTAAHTLRARGLVGWDETAHPRMNPVVAEMLLDYAHPQQTLFVDTYVVSTRAIPFLYVVGKQAIYEQCQPEPDVLQLRILLDEEQLWRRLFPKLEQKEPMSGEMWHGKITQNMLYKGVEVAREDQEAACQLFSNFLTLPLAARLAEAYHDPKVVQYMGRWEQTPTQQRLFPDAALTILQGQEWSFLLWVEEPQKGDEALVVVQPAENNLLQAYILQVLPPSVRPVDR